MIQNVNGIPVLAPKEELLLKNQGAYVVVTIQNRSVAWEIKENLQSKGMHVIINEELLRWMAYRLWKLTDMAEENK